MTYAIEKQLTVHPSKCWIMKRLDNKWHYVLGPFDKQEGQDQAEALVKILNEQNIQFIPNF